MFFSIGLWMLSCAEDDTGTAVVPVQLSHRVPVAKGETQLCEAEDPSLPHLPSTILAPPPASGVANGIQILDKES